MRIALCGVVAAIGVVGCSELSPDPDPSTGVPLRAAVVESLQGTLTPSDRFVIPVSLPRGSAPVLDSAQAIRLAWAFLHQFWEAAPQGLREKFSEGQGRLLEFWEVTRCGDVRIGMSPLVVDSDRVDYVTRRAFDERWLVRFCGSGGQGVGYVGVSRYATDVRVSGDTAVVFPLVAGGEFEVAGLRRPWEEVPRFSPESAAILAFRCTGLKAKTRPRVVLQHGAFALLALWEVVLERPARLRTTSWGEVARDTVYLGIIIQGGGGTLREGVAIAADSQPEAVSIKVIENLPPAVGPIPAGWEAAYATVAVPRDRTVPIRLQAVQCN